ncbi:hypothetical protein GBAR_LOCUS30145 [Geodia barretti]|uniref:Uncharacterized protein n=1 Tax=Geodia barretti TaxID=519541 RepID=A0AA35XKF2_GEOBA|nr:hypothetical protein GBAR_LOCUS30145 [Geodia barretti]
MVPMIQTTDHMRDEAAVGIRQAWCDRSPVTRLARDTVPSEKVLQAKEESRDGSSRTPNTSNDLAIARQIQEDLYQLEDEEPPSSGAIGTGLPPTAATAAMSKSNFESLRFLDDDPNYYGKGYDIGREYMVTEHNSISEEQKERNRNIPRKSVRKNNYSGRWSDEYRYRDFDKRGHRNLHAEKYQPHERKTWAVGGTGIVTACVRGMQRSDTLLEREELDLAFEGRQELEEIESSIDSQLIERMSHQYEYKEKHRPKDPSVKPVTECAVCLDSFHVGDPLRYVVGITRIDHFC